MQKKDNNKFKNNNNHNCQKIKLYGSLTTKELKKKHSSRPIGGAETGNQAERTCGKVVAGGPGRLRIADWAVPRSRADKPGGIAGE